MKVYLNAFFFQVVYISSRESLHQTCKRYLGNTQACTESQKIQVFQGITQNANITQQQDTQALSTLSVSVSGQSIGHSIWSTGEGRAFLMFLSFLVKIHTHTSLQTLVSCSLSEGLENQFPCSYRNIFCFIIKFSGITLPVLAYSYLPWLLWDKESASAQLFCIAE